MNFPRPRAVRYVAIEQVAVDHKGNGDDHESDRDSDDGDGDGRSFLPAAVSAILCSDGEL